MVPPPTTPTPHRFLTQTPSHPQSIKSITSSFRTQHNVSQSPQQFAPTPKFAPREFPEDVHTPAASTSPLPSRLTRPNPQRLKTGEEIDDFSSPPSPGSPEEGVNGKVHSVRPSVDDVRGGRDLDGDDSITEAPNVRKRRRESAHISKGETIHISSLSPTLPLSPTSVHSREDDKEHEWGLSPRPTLPPPSKLTPHSHFRFSQQPSAQGSTPQANARPSFLLPAPPVDPPESTPLPEAFSPNRRGVAKYIPGGLASTMRECILEASTKGEGSTDSTTKGFVGVDVGDVRTGQGIALVQGAGSELRGEEARWLLLGQGKARGILRRGAKVGVKRPMWDVRFGDREGEKWIVGIDWSVL